MKHDFYIKDADRGGVEEAYRFLSEFYTRYPSGKEVGEALHQVRRDLDLIPPEKERKPRAPRTRQKTDQEL